jgi:hypothetical protein
MAKGVSTVLAARQTSRRSTRPTAFAPARRRDGAPLPRGKVLSLATFRIARVPTRKARSAWRDGDAVIALAVLWIASAVRVVGAFERHEVFGTEATLAFICLIIAPLLVFRGQREGGGRRGSATGHRPTSPGAA